ncbi:condensin complex protein MksE [Rhodocyclus purpureus]|uniref:condensin complex protein MksE n=1 Tax=Rhodocyclus purpureus TaxID=1067 RepID=UPI0019145F52|nr:hypothetical protein [Rhodocyclus purpureus]MBK5915717.1 hypothetical protein [Rhodocyclus purpureus]
MLDLPDKLEPLFRELSRGRHLSAHDGELFIALQQRPDDYVQIFAALGFKLVQDARAFYYFEGSNRGLADRVQRLALFVYILIDAAADAGASISELLSGKELFVDALPHLSSERYRGYMAHVEVTNQGDLSDIVRTLENFGFVVQLNNGFRFLPPIHRIVDACRQEAPTSETTKTPVAEAAC